MQHKQIAGYLYAYFSGDESRADSQQIRFAMSRDGLHWLELNGGEPILESHINDCGVRDPFLIRLQHGGFALIGTDLNTNAPAYADANGAPQWRRMETHGRTDILVWKSDDLVHWNGPRTLPVARDLNAGNAWAPKAVFVPERGQYLITWSSTTAADNYAKQRIYGCWTTDFTSCSPAFLLIDDAHSRIDTLIAPHNGRWLLIVKDEVDKRIDVKTADHLFDTDANTPETSTLSREFTVVPQRALAEMTWVEGPALVHRADGSTILFVDEYARSKRGYIPLISNDPTRADSFRALDAAEYEMPRFARHGSLLPIIEEEWGALAGAYVRA